MPRSSSGLGYKPVKRSQNACDTGSNPVRGAKPLTLKELNYIGY